MRAFLILICSFAFFIFIFNASVYALSPTPATPSAIPVESKLTELKERIATQVAKLKIIEKRAIRAKIAEAVNHQLVLLDSNGNKRLADADELTKFTDLKGATIGISDLEKNQIVDVIGLYNTESRRILARLIKLSNPPARIWARVEELDKKNFSLKISIDQPNDTKEVNVETATKTFEYTKDAGLVKSGFSKIQIGERMLVVGYEKDNTITAARILLLPEFSPQPEAGQPLTETATITPTP